MLEALWFVFQLVFIVGCLIVLCVVGLATAIAAAAAAIVAFPLSALLSVIFDIAFIDALAWTWSLLTVVALVIGTGIVVFGRRRKALGPESA